MTPDWIAVDWGTSHLRAFAMQGGGDQARRLEERHSDRGMGKLSRGEFEPALLALVEDWLASPPAKPMLVVICGMAGARQGWIEAPYRPTPGTPTGPDGMQPVPTSDPRLCAFIVPGLSQMKPADVMRGEETQIAGALALNPGFDGVICLPGTHSKWVACFGRRSRQLSNLHDR